MVIATPSLIICLPSAVREQLNKYSPHGGTILTAAHRHTVNSAGNGRLNRPSYGVQETVS
jgi:hypothetical protein